MREEDSFQPEPSFLTKDLLIMMMIMKISFLKTYMPKNILNMMIIIFENMSANQRFRFQLCSIVFLDWICTNGYGCVNGFNPIDHQLLVLLLITCYETSQGVLLVGNYQLVEVDHYQVLEVVHVPAIELTFTIVLYSSLSYVYYSMY